MFTVCPKCAMTLAVTATDLRTGQGYVRCGRCLNVFNALLTLSDEQSEPDAPPPSFQADPASNSQITNALTAEPGADDELVEFELEPETPHALPADGPSMQLATESSSDGAIENESSNADSTGTFETIILEGEAITQTEEFVPEESVDSEMAALTQRLGMAANEPLVVPAHFSGARTRLGSDALEETDEDLGILPPEQAEQLLSADDEAHIHAAAAAADLLDIDIASLSRPYERPWPQLAGVIVLGMLLLAQIVNHWRDTLAGSPLWGGAISGLYSALGIPLDPHWTLSAYDIRQQGALADPIDSHVIRVRMSVSNHAARAQPVPLVRLVLLDRYGKRIAGRDLTPTEYWPRDRAASAYLSHDQRVDTEVAVRDPAAESSSFELDVCLPSARGVLHCAADSAGDSHP